MTAIDPSVTGTGFSSRLALVLFDSSLTLIMCRFIFVIEIGTRTTLIFFILVFIVIFVVLLKLLATIFVVLFSIGFGQGVGQGGGVGGYGHIVEAGGSVGHGVVGSGDTVVDRFGSGVVAGHGGNVGQGTGTVVGGEVGHEGCVGHRIFGFVGQEDCEAHRDCE